MASGSDTHVHVYTCASSKLDFAATKVVVIQYSQCAQYLPVEITWHVCVGNSRSAYFVSNVNGHALSF